MSEDISLLPEELRKKEDEMKKTAPAKAGAASSELRFSTPLDESEDIETIEIDEGEVEQVLANEPLLTRMVYKTSEFFHGLGNKLFHPGEPEPPPKLPPQFFAPPPAKPRPTSTAPVAVSSPSTTASQPPMTSGAVGSSHATMPVASSATKPMSPMNAMSLPGSTATFPAASEMPPKPVTPAQAGSSLLAAAVAPQGSSTTASTAGVAANGAAKPKARIIPAESAPRRVRVIKRVRKPVRVSFVSEDDLRALHIDIPKRKFTLALLSVLFVVILIGGVFALGQQQAAADTELATAKKQSADVLGVTAAKQKEWSNYQDLQPRLKALIGLLDQHMSPTHLLASLEQNTLKDVEYDSFSLTPDHRVSLSVKTSSYESAARQIVVFQHADFVKSLDATGYSATYDDKNPLVPQSVSFQLTLTLAPSALQ